MRPMRHQQRQISEDELMAHLREERWDTYASASREPKTLEIMINGCGFRVVVRGVETYKGQNVSDVVRAYNEAV